MATDEPLASRMFERAYGWLASPRPGRNVAAARFGLGATLFFAYLQILPYAHTFYGPNGIGGGATLARHPFYPGLAFGWYQRWALLSGVESMGLVWLLYGVVMLAAVAFAVGFRPRIAGTVGGAVHMLFLAHNPNLDGGWSKFIGPFIVYLALCDSGAALSVDSWLRRRRGDPNPERHVAPWGARILQVHLCVIYLMTGFERLDAAGWVSGEMVLRALMNDEYGRFDLPWQTLAPLFTGITWAVLIIEPAAPFLLWLRGVAEYCALVLIGLHLGLEILTDTGWWQFTMCSALMLFIPDRWVDRMLPRPWRRPSPAGAPT